MIATRQSLSRQNSWRRFDELRTLGKFSVKLSPAPQQTEVFVYKEWNSFNDQPQVEMRRVFSTICWVYLYHGVVVDEFSMRHVRSCWKLSFSADELRVKLWMNASILSRFIETSLFIVRPRKYGHLALGLWKSYAYIFLWSVKSWVAHQ